MLAQTIILLAAIIAGVVILNKTIDVFVDFGVGRWERKQLRKENKYLRTTSTGVLQEEVKQLEGEICILAPQGCRSCKTRGTCKTRTLCEPHGCGDWAEKEGSES